MRPRSKSAHNGTYKPIIFCHLRCIQAQNGFSKAIEHFGWGGGEGASWCYAAPCGFIPTPTAAK